METTLPLNNGPVLGSEILGSHWLDPAYWFNHGSEILYAFFVYIASNNFHSLLITILFLCSIFFLTIISYSVVRMFEIRKKEHAHLQHEIEEYAHHKAEREQKKQTGEEGSKNERWNKTLTYLFSQSPGDWKLSVIEADSMLEALMDQMGFKGENLSEKLKMATQANFRGVNSAWEVHNVRNKIAHEGSAYELSQHEAKRIIALYEQIFRDFGYI